MAKPDTPAPVALNLDTLERENKPQPFAIVIGGKRYVMIDAQELDYRDLVASQRQAAEGNPDAAIGLLIPGDDRDEFFANRLPSWKLEKLFLAYNQHHGLPTPGEAPASSTS